MKDESYGKAVAAGGVPCLHFSSPVLWCGFQRQALASTKQREKRGAESLVLEQSSLQTGGGRKDCKATLSGWETQQTLSFMGRPFQRLWLKTTARKGKSEQSNISRAEEQNYLWLSQQLRCDSTLLFPTNLFTQDSDLVILQDNHALGLPLCVSKSHRLVNFYPAWPLYSIINLVSSQIQ